MMKMMETITNNDPKILFISIATKLIIKNSIAIFKKRIYIIYKMRRICLSITFYLLLQHHIFKKSIADLVS
jgi:hypothetical protein